MRIYFGHARAVQRTVTQLLEEIPEAWSALYRQVQSWRSRLTTADFSVVDGLIFLQQPSALQDPEMLLRLFHFMAHHGLKLSATTEYRIEQALPALAATPPRGAELWLYLQETLLQPHAADALRAMHSLRLLTLLLPELKLIDSLVVRDFYHRFTVDEHSFLAIESLHRLKQSQSEWDKRYAELLGELEDPELLYLALLLHDTGKECRTAIMCKPVWRLPIKPWTASMSIRKNVLRCCFSSQVIWSCRQRCGVTFLIPQQLLLSQTRWERLSA